MNIWAEFFFSPLASVWFKGVVLLCISLEFCFEVLGFGKFSVCGFLRIGGFLFFFLGFVLFTGSTGDYEKANKIKRWKIKGKWKDKGKLDPI